VLGNSSWGLNAPTSFGYASSRMVGESVPSILLPCPGCLLGRCPSSRVGV